ncbi:hypothetical protein AMATHDRAFT_54811 [Amanita thiersii Skay4041]|uniref:Uncharacterized protein n=1 Tax=Amanita thiersii Skay4041 TaxID=703135 RepID=A0A2A9NRK4_9AGAR|nr:hypothetical protein AMATHDRAFT_54811 [Amanita thiersii Skay4041]
MTCERQTCTPVRTIEATTRTLVSAAVCVVVQGTSNRNSCPFFIDIISSHYARDPMTMPER